MQTHLKEKSVMLFFTDMLAMMAAIILATAIGHKGAFSFHLIFHYQWGYVTLLASVVILFIILDIYSFHRMPVRFLRQAIMVGEGLVASASITTFLFFFFRDTVPRAVFILFYVFSFILITLFRYYISRRALSSIIWRVLLIGDEQRCSEVARLIGSRLYLRSKVIGYVSYGLGTRAGERLTRLGGVDELATIVERERIDQVIVASARIDDDLTKLLLECMKRKIKVTDFREEIEDITGKVPIEHLTDNWFVLQLSTTDKRYFWLAKRSFDFAVACAGLCLALPLLSLAALLIKLDSRGPVFYFQDRVGRGGVLFRVWKLRTMVADADKTNVHWTESNDNRITRVGGLLRKMRIDELPQLVNILKGDMSLIGPRPEAFSLVEMYRKAIPYYDERHMVTPGITGWAQISYRYGNSIEDTRQKLMFDYYYIKNRNLALDTTIFLRTIKIVMTGKGAL